MKPENLAHLLGKAWGTYGQWKANQGRKDLHREMQQLRGDLEELRLHATSQQATEIGAFGNALRGSAPIVSAVGTLLISRKSQTRGAAGKVSVSVDGEDKGGIWSGRSLSVAVSAGSHVVEVKSWGRKTQEVVIVLPNQHKHIEVEWNSRATQLLLSKATSL